MAHNRFNQIRDNVYISVLKIYDEDYLFLEHNELLQQEEINILREIENQYLISYEKFLKFCAI